MAAGPRGGSGPGFALMRGADQWVRASYQDAALVGGVVQLAWEDQADAGTTPEVPPSRGAGLAFDALCRLYHSRPDAGLVERLLWAAQHPLSPSQPGPAPRPLFSVPPIPAGDFAPARAPQPLQAPSGLAVDGTGRLFIALHGARTVLVLDPWGEDVLGRIQLPGRPLDLVSEGDGERVLALTESPPGLFALTARGRPRDLGLPPGVGMPGRITWGAEAGTWLLSRAAGAEAALVDLGAPGCSHPIPWATDLAIYRPAAQTEGEGPVLVVARRPGESFLRLRPGPAGLAQLPGLSARGYDGLGLVATPDQRIAFWTAKGLRYAVAAPNRYRRSGRVIGFRLDSGDFQTRWGRVFLDACIPRDAAVRVRCLVADEPPEGPLVPRQPPANLPHAMIPHDHLSPPLPTLGEVLDPGDAAAPLHRRAEGLELPWVRRDPADPFSTYEAPATDTPGRYLWVVLELSGNGRVSPRLRALRVEHPAHDLQKRLPQVLTRGDGVEGFLGRFLAPLAGLLSDLDGRSRLRRALLDADSAPVESLPWLAGFFGLVMDEGWSESVRRRLIAEVMDLFRYRGTIRGLKRFLAIVTGVEPTVLEHYRMRGGAVIGEPVARGSHSVLGAGMRVGGQVGRAGETSLVEEPLADAFETHAHRFTVMLPGLLSEATLELARRVLEVQRPAHTLYQLCTVASGSRVGSGLHLGLSSVVGRGSGWEPIRIGGSALGRGVVLGAPPLAVGVGTRVGEPLGQGSRVG